MSALEIEIKMAKPEIPIVKPHEREEPFIPDPIPERKIQPAPAAPARPVVIPAAPVPVRV